MNAELDEGSTDGTYKKIPPDRSEVEVPLTERREWSWRYGVEDARIKMRPDGRPARWSAADHG